VLIIILIALALVFYAGLAFAVIGALLIFGLALMRNLRKKG
jgi:hypothetical protein